jgi:hypothetical protein
MKFVCLAFLIHVSLTWVIEATANSSACHRSCLQVCQNSREFQQPHLSCEQLCTNRCQLKNEEQVITNTQLNDCLVSCSDGEVGLEKSSCESQCYSNQLAYNKNGSSVTPDAALKEETDEPTGRTGETLETTDATAEANQTTTSVADSTTTQKEEDKIEDVGEGCVGFGREYCYKICRLIHEESIKVCLCACCRCKF